VCFAPIGIACYLRDLAPGFVTMFVARGQGEVSRRQEMVGDAIRHVRTRGEALVAFGLPHRAGPAAPVDITVSGNGNGAGAGVRVRDDREAAQRLPIPGYDSLSASQVVERLAGLGADDLEAVRHYEETHRNRRTIIGKIEQLI
jgi:hypothetical protein